MGAIIKMVIECEDEKYEWHISAGQATAFCIAKAIESYIDCYIHPSRINRNDNAKGANRAVKYL